MNEFEAIEELVWDFPSDDIFDGIINPESMLYDKVPLLEVYDQMLGRLENIFSNQMVNIEEKIEELKCMNLNL